MLELILLVVCLAAIATIRGLFVRVARLERQALALHDEINLLRGGRSEAAAGPRSAVPGIVLSPPPAPGSPTPPVAVPGVPLPPAAEPPVSPTPGPAPTMPASPTAPSGPATPSSVPAVPAAGARPAPGATGASLEERLGTRWAVWIGGLALGLGGLLLVRYSIEQGYFGPAARIVMGLVFAGLLAVAGEWFRRGEHDLGLTAIPSAHIPGILTAAATVTGFAAIYAGHALYHLVGPATAVILLGAIGLAAVVAAALHGPALAALGLVGAYVTPLLVTSQRPNPWPVVLYLAVVAATTLSLARLRRWLWLAVLATSGAVLWCAPFLVEMTRNPDWRLAGYLHLVLQLGLAAGFIAVDPHRAVADRVARPDPVGTGTLGALALAALVMLAFGRFELASSIPFALATAAILMASAWLAAPAVGGAVLAGLVLLTATATWPGLRLTAAAQADEFWRAASVPETIASFLTFAALAALALSAVASLRLWRGRLLPTTTAALYALAATLTPLLALIIAYLRVTQFDRSIPFAFAAAALSTIFGLVASGFARREIEELAGDRLATGAYAAAGIAAFCLGLVMVLARGYLTVAFALTALATAVIATRRDIPLLRHVVTALAIVVLGRLAWDPRIMGADVGSWPVVNWLLVGYGVPAGAFWAAARQMETRDAGVSPRIADATAVLLVGLLAFFQIRHALHGGDILAPSSSHVEMGLMALVALGLSYALLRLDLGRANPVFRVASIGFGVVSGVIILVGLGISENPLLSSDVVHGPPVTSSLMLAYLLPGAMAAFLARASRGLRPGWYVGGLAALAALLVFGYVTLEVRHVFQGPRLDAWRSTAAPEQWSYSAAWLLLGIALLAYGILWRSFEARLASAALVLLSVVKVFWFDLAGLTGIWRPLSFIVLGLVLIGIGLAYQTLLFSRSRSTPEPSEPGSIGAPS